MKHPIGTHVILGFLIVIAARGALARELTFEQRVEAQRAIERVYYSHQIGATRPFADAVPRDLIRAPRRFAMGSDDNCAGGIDENPVSLCPADTSTPSARPAQPPSGMAFYYLVSGKNACGEGTLGATSSGQQRPNPAPCP